MIKKLLVAGLVGSALASLAASPVQAAKCTNDVFNKVMNGGKLIAGVKADYKPWGFRDEDGKLVGMEVDMAQDVADALGVDAEDWMEPPEQEWRQRR